MSNNTFINATHILFLLSLEFVEKNITLAKIRVTSQLCLLVLSIALFLCITQENGTAWFIIAVVFLGLTIFTGLKAKEKTIQAKVQIEEKERARIKENQS